MISLAPYKYRNIFAEEGGPVGSLEYSDVSVLNERCHHATAFLRDDIVDGYKRQESLNVGDGAGTHKSPLTARFMALSEALERWALRQSVRSDKRGAYGFDVDGSSNGMAAYPGLFDFQARDKAYAEAIERYCLIAWWEGYLPSHSIAVPHESTRGIEIENPFSSHKVVVLWTCCDDRYYAMSFGFGKSTEDAVWRSAIELARTEAIIKEYYEKRGFTSLADLDDVSHIYEKRMLYFSTPEGFSEFLHRMEFSPNISKLNKSLEIVFDGEIPGPWSDYATVWRTVFKPISRDYLTQKADYFFW